MPRKSHVKPWRPRRGLKDSSEAIVQWQRATAGLLLALLLAVPLRARAASPLEGPGLAVQVFVSVEARRLWVVRGGDTLFSAPVAVGRTETQTLLCDEPDSTTYTWTTPQGTRKVLAKAKNPIWHVPDWHYCERAQHDGLGLVKMKRNVRYPIPQGAYLEVRGDNVGWVWHEGVFHPFHLGREIIIAGKLYMPPVGTRQRAVPHALGDYALYLGGGYLIHGTNEYDLYSIGEAASHGCIRMNNADLKKVYDLVPKGAEVRIY